MESARRALFDTNPERVPPLAALPNTQSAHLGRLTGEARDKAIECLKKFGYSGAQSCAIFGAAPCQGHISGVMDIPNACAPLWLPTDIFAFDMMPGADGPVKHIGGSVDVPLAPDL